MTTPFIHPVIAAIEAGGTAEPQVSLTTAMLCVFLVVLGFMAKKLADLGRSVRALEERLAGASSGRLAGGAAHGATAHAPESEVDTETAVVIAATVAALWGPSARIVSVGEHHGQVRLWALEGRRQIFASHKIR